MHYYKKNLGDYYKKAGRLSVLQHGAYTLLLDACYDRERFPTEEEAIEWVWASTPDEEQAVRFVLTRFFVKQTDGTYLQKRVFQEIQTYKISEIQNRLIALSREAKKQKRDEFAKGCDQLRSEIKHEPLSKTYEAWTDLVEALIKTHEGSPNQEPITNNHKPITKEKDNSCPELFNQDAKPINPPAEKISFEDFWKAYPKGDRKKDAEKKWKSLSLGKQKLALADCRVRYRNTETQFIPAAVVYLNGERWVDDLKKQPMQPQQSTVKDFPL